MVVENGNIVFTLDGGNVSSITKEQFESLSKENDLTISSDIIDKEE